MIPKYEELDLNIRYKFEENLTLHIGSVQEAGRRIGVPEYQLKIHDLSKWSEEEFGAYALHFFGGGAPELFAQAWLHHIHHNPHHWQHWIFPDNFELKGANVYNGVVRMPDNFALEMIADWMGASIAYTGTDDMGDWLKKHIPKIRLHPQTVDYVCNVLESLGYGEILETVKFPKEDEKHG